MTPSATATDCCQRCVIARDLIAAWVDDDNIHRFTKALARPAKRHEGSVRRAIAHAKPITINSNEFRRGGFEFRRHFSPGTAETNDQTCQ